MRSNNPLKQEILRYSNLRLKHGQHVHDLTKKVDDLNEDVQYLLALLEECEQDHNIHSFEDSDPYTHTDDTVILDKLNKSTEDAETSSRKQINDILSRV